jgi:uncharacterized protein (DUF4415 family)
MPKTAKPLSDKDGNVPELTATDLKRFKSAVEVAPHIVERHTRGRQKAPTKVQTTIRLDADVVAYFKGLGRGWQTRINDELRRLIKA